MQQASKAMASLFGLGVAVYSATGAAIVKPVFPPDPLWQNQLLTPDMPSCKSPVQIEPGAPSQYPDDSVLVRIRGTFRAETVPGSGIGGSTPAVGGFLTRGGLDASQSGGVGLPGGFTAPPPSPGALTGVMWPFRDEMNFATSPNPAIPGGNDAHPSNGTLATNGLAILNVDAAQDYAMYGTRLNPGSGATSPISFFLLMFTCTDFTTPRTIRLRFDATAAEVRLPNGQIDRDITFGEGYGYIVIPAPGAGVLLGLVGVMAARRRR